MSRSTPHIFDREITVPKCQVNRYGEPNCNHVHAGELPSQNEGGWAGSPEDLIPRGWTAQTVADPRLGQQMYECSSCNALLTLDETTGHRCDS